MSTNVRRFPSSPGDSTSTPSNESPTALDLRVREVLIRLPRERAGEAFTARVLERTGAAPGHPRRLRSLAAAALLCAAGALGAHEWNSAQAHQAAAERMASLRAEYEMLQTELQSLQRTADAERPVVYLGGEGDVEYVLDLSRLAVNPSATRPAVGRLASSSIRPASY